MSDPENIDFFLERLEKEYGNVGIVYRTLLNYLLNIDKPTPNNPKTVINLMRALDELIISVESLNKSEYLCNQRLISDLIERLP